MVWLCLCFQSITCMLVIALWLCHTLSLVATQFQRVAVAFSLCANGWTAPRQSTLLLTLQRAPSLPVCARMRSMQLVAPGFFVSPLGAVHVPPCPSPAQYYLHSTVVVCVNTSCLNYFAIVWVRICVSCRRFHSPAGVATRCATLWGGDPTDSG